MNEQPRVWYPAKMLTGEPLQGIKIPKVSQFYIPPHAVGHILYHGMFLCGRTVAEVLMATKSPKGIERTGAIPGHPFCIECSNVYKSRPEFPYKKWEESVKG